jgi:preprotein translocase subunit SecG
MLYSVIFAILFVSAVLLIILVLLQKGSSEFALAYGSNPMQSIFGSTEADTVLTKITYFLAAVFLASAFTLTLLSKKEQGQLLEKLQKTPVEKVENSTNKK